MLTTKESDFVSSLAKFCPNLKASVALSLVLCTVIFSIKVKLIDNRGVARIFPPPNPLKSQILFGSLIKGDATS